MNKFKSIFLTYLVCKLNLPFGCVKGTLDDSKKNEADLVDLYLDNLNPNNFTIISSDYVDAVQITPMDNKIIKGIYLWNENIWDKTEKSHCKWLTLYFNSENKLVIILNTLEDKEKNVHHLSFTDRARHLGIISAMYSLNPKLDTESTSRRDKLDISDDFDQMYYHHFFRAIDDRSFEIYQPVRNDKFVQITDKSEVIWSFEREASPEVGCYKVQIFIKDKLFRYIKLSLDNGEFRYYKFINDDNTWKMIAIQEFKETYRSLDFKDLEHDPKANSIESNGSDTEKNIAQLKKEGKYINTEINIGHRTDRFAYIRRNIQGDHFLLLNEKYREPAKKITYNGQVIFEGNMKMFTITMVKTKHDEHLIQIVYTSHLGFMPTLYFKKSNEGVWEKMYQEDFMDLVQNTVGKSDEFGFNCVDLYGLKEGIKLPDLTQSIKDKIAILAIPLKNTIVMPKRFEPAQEKTKPNGSGSPEASNSTSTPAGSSTVIPGVPPETSVLPGVPSTPITTPTEATPGSKTNGTAVPSKDDKPILVSQPRASNQPPLVPSWNPSKLWTSSPVPVVVKTPEQQPDTENIGNKSPEQSRESSEEGEDESKEEKVKKENEEEEEYSSDDSMVSAQSGEEIPESPAASEKLQPVETKLGSLTHKTTTIGHPTGPVGAGNSLPGSISMTNDPDLQPSKTATPSSRQAKSLVLTEDTSTIQTHFVPKPSTTNQPGSHSTSESTDHPEEVEGGHEGHDKEIETSNSQNGTSTPVYNSSGELIIPGSEQASESPKPSVPTEPSSSPRPSVKLFGIPEPVPTNVGPSSPPVKEPVPPKSPEASPMDPKEPQKPSTPVAGSTTVIPEVSPKSTSTPIVIAAKPAEHNTTGVTNGEPKLKEKKPVHVPTAPSNVKDGTDKSTGTQPVKPPTKLAEDNKPKGPAIVIKEAKPATDKPTAEKAAAKDTIKPVQTSEQPGPKDAKKPVTSTTTITTEPKAKPAQENKPSIGSKEKPADTKPTIPEDQTKPEDARIVPSKSPNLSGTSTEESKDEDVVESTTTNVELLEVGFPRPDEEDDEESLKKRAGFMTNSTIFAFVTVLAYMFY